MIENEWPVKMLKKISLNKAYVYDLAREKFLTEYDRGGKRPPCFAASNLFLRPLMSFMIC